MEIRLFNLVLKTLIHFSLKRIFSDDCSKYVRSKILPQTNSTATIFSNFYEFSELSMNCDQTYNATSFLLFLPKYSCLMDKSFSIEKLFNETQAISFVNIVNLNGIDINNPIPYKTSNNINLGIFLSVFNIYKGKDLIEFSTCSYNYYDETSTFLNSVQALSLITVSYPSFWCPYFFRNSSLFQLHFSEITNSFLYKNRLNFVELNLTNNSHSIQLNSLYTLSFNLNYEILNKKMLSKNLFLNSKELVIEGVLNGIQIDIFKEFKALKFIEFRIDNMRDFFHQGNTWMIYLSFYKNYSLTSVTKTEVKRSFLFLGFKYLKHLVSFNKIYEYPNEDICLFKEFPHHRLVYPVMTPGKELECTCTLYWLQKYKSIYEFLFNNTSDYNLNYQYNILSQQKNTFIYCNSSWTFLNCDLEVLFNNCQIISLESDESRGRSFFKLNNDMDIYYFIKWLQFILLTILRPTLCLLGILNNALTIIVIRNKNKRKEFHSTMYEFIVINASINIVYCIIIILSMINTCVFYGSGIFCSSIYQNDSSQLFKIIIVIFLGNVIKMCSNVSYLSFSISRLKLILVHKGNNETNEKITKLKLLVYFVAVILTSCLLSVYKFFQYNLNIDRDFRKDFPFESRDEIFCADLKNKLECQLFYAFKIVDRSLNDILCVFLNVSIDLILLRKFKKHLDNKKLHIVDVDLHKIIEKSKKNINRMILVNSLLYIFSHLPEFTITLLLIIYSKKISQFCMSNLSCDLINEEAEFFSLISIACQFYIFKIFDKNFKSSYSDIKSSTIMFLKKLICVKKVDNLNGDMIRQINTNEQIELKNLRELIGNGLMD